MDEDKVKALQSPFEEQDIEWRIQKKGLSSAGKPWALVVPYITNRAIQKRLDDVFGVFGWENVYKPAPQTTVTVKEWEDGKQIKKEKQVNNWLCGITVHGEKRSVTKWDGSEETNIEPIKGGLSGSMKRTGAQLGIGRYLYQLEVDFATCVIVNSRHDCNEDYPNYDSIKKSNVYTNFAWANPQLPEWALPRVDFEQFIKPITKAETMNELRHAFEDAYKKAESTGNSENTDWAIAEKDKRKSFIENQLKEEIATNFDSVEKWLKTQTDSFSLVRNQSAVDAIYKTTKQSLVNKIKAFKIDGAIFLKDLKKAYNLRVRQLNTTTEKQK